MVPTKNEYDEGPDFGGVVHIPGRTPFAQIPTWVLYHPGLSDGAIRLYGIFAQYGGSNHIFPGRKELASRIGKTPRSITRLISELSTAKVIVATPHFTQGGRQTSNHYVLAWRRPFSDEQIAAFSEPVVMDVQGEVDTDVQPGVDTDVQPITIQSELEQKSLEDSSGKGLRRQLFEAVWSSWNRRPWVDGTKMTKNQRGRINAAVTQLLEIDATPAEWNTRAQEYRTQHPDWEFTPQAVLNHWTTLEPQSSPPVYRSAEEILAEEASESEFEMQRAREIVHHVQNQRPGGAS